MQILQQGDCKYPVFEQFVQVAEKVSLLFNLGELVSHLTSTKLKTFFSRMQSDCHAHLLLLYEDVVQTFLSLSKICIILPGIINLCA